MNKNRSTKTVEIVITEPSRRHSFEYFEEEDTGQWERTVQETPQQEDLNLNAQLDEDVDEKERLLLPPLGNYLGVSGGVRMDSPSREIMPDQGSRCTDIVTVISGINFFDFGSINVSICNLSAATIAIGTTYIIYIYIYILIGMLNMPYAMTISGLGLGLLCLIGGAASCIWSLYLLIQTARACKTRSFNLAIRKSAGNLLAFILDLSILFAYLGYIIVFQIMSKIYNLYIMSNLYRYITYIYSNEYDDKILRKNNQSFSGSRI